MTDRGGLVKKIPKWNDIKEVAQYGVGYKNQPEERIYKPGLRIAWNTIPVVFNIILPWAVFVWTTTFLSFRLRHSHNVWANTGAAVGLFPCLVFLFLQKQAWDDNDPNPMWYKFGFLVCMIAYLAGITVSHYLYHDYLRDFYIVQDMEYYPEIDVSKYLGQNMMDAGRILFVPGTHLDLSRSWHFTNGDTYCVVPIVASHGLAPRGSYDFWAVGKNCCSPTSSDFRCTGFNNPRIHSGLRSLDLGAQPFYRLAVQQAETIHNVFSTHPLFFQWTEDPFFVMDSWRANGYNYYIVAVLCYLIWCFLTAGLALWQFGKITKMKPPDENTSIL